MNMPKISVVVVTYRRSKNLEGILKAWLEQTDDVWLCDCGLDFKTTLPIKTIKFNPDPGNKARHAVALLTDGDYVIKADDDLVPKQGLIKDFLNNWQLNSDGILGIHGRKFIGESYYKNTRAFIANRIIEPTEVNFVGICTFTSRDNLAFDLKGCKSPIEDLFWQMKAFPKVPKYVIPTKNYTQLPESNDKNCLFYNMKARKIREQFYQKYNKRAIK